jgi:hypothetical protein
MLGLSFSDEDVLPAAAVAADLWAPVAPRAGQHAEREAHGAGEHLSARGVGHVVERDLLDDFGHCQATPHRAHHSHPQPRHHGQLSGGSRRADVSIVI